MVSPEKIISIIIPSYNRAHTLSNSIESVVNQTNPNWELIVVDDGSTDHTADLVKNFLSDKRIRYFFQLNSGVSSARNRGAKSATGNYLIFLDSDDTFYPTLVQKIYEAEFFKYDLICWQVLKKINGKLSVWKPSYLGRMYNGLKVSFLAGSICYKKHIFEKAGGYDQKMSFGENYELGLRVSQLPDLKIQILNSPLLKYTTSSETRISNSLPNRIKSHLHQYYKHQMLYDQDLKAKAKMNYIIGYVMERSGKIEEASKWYKTSWRIFPWNLKPLLRYIFLIFLK